MGAVGLLDAGLPGVQAEAAAVGHATKANGIAPVDGDPETARAAMIVPVAGSLGRVIEGTGG